MVPGWREKKDEVYADTDLVAMLPPYLKSRCEKAISESTDGLAIISGACDIGAGISKLLTELVSQLKKNLSNAMESLEDQVAQAKIAIEHGC